ncbi:MAG: hypothetical protein ACP5KB_00830 [Thermoprotei archaeon]
MSNAPNSRGVPSSSLGGVVSANKILNAVLVFSRDDESIHRRLTYDIIKESLRGRYKKVEVYVISPLKPPLYLRQVRDLLLSNIHVSIVVKYSGCGADSLRRLLEELVKSGNDIRVYSSRSLRDEYLEVVKQFGITSIIVGESQ